MGDFLTGSDGSSQNVVICSGLQVSTSQLDIPIAWMRGQARMSPNCIDYVNFKKHSINAKGKGGGKGGQYDYTAAVDLALGWGPITTVLNVWYQGSTTTTTTLGALGYALLTSAAWSYMSSEFPTHALTYPNVTRIVNDNADLGSSASVPDIGVEAQLLPYTDVFVSDGYINPSTMAVTPGSDVNMADFLPDFLTGSLGGMGMPSGYIPDLTAFREYQAAQGLFFSPYLVNQEKANDIINRWAQLANSWIYDSGCGLVVVPLGDMALTANGYTYTPDNSPVWNIGQNPNDFVARPGDPPVEVDIKDEADIKNWITVTINDRTMGYVSNPKVYKTGSLVRLYGRNDGDQVQGDEVKVPSIGDIIAQLIGRREANITKTYKFKTNWTFKRGLPGMIVTLTDPSQNMYLEPVRITDVDEEDDGTLTWQAENFPGNVGIYYSRPSQPGPLPSTPNQLADPGSVNTPAVMEPAGQNPGDTVDVLIAASGGPLWGGCDVFLSFDGVNFGTQIGTITAPAIQGKLTANLASYSSANPDTGDTLAVDCTISGGEPEPVTNADAAALRTLSLVCAPAATSGSDKVLDPSGELLAFGNTAATGTNTANLTYLYRNADGTGPSAHSTNDLFTLFDMSGLGGSTITYPLPAQYVGQTLYLKFASFNLFGKNTQDLSVCQRYIYTPVGRGFGGGSGGVPTAPTGLSTTPGIQMVEVSWAANPVTDNVTSYQVYRAPGLGASFGSASLIQTVEGPSYLDTGLVANTGYTYFVVAVNSVGSSSPSAGVNATTLTTNISLAGAAIAKTDISTTALSSVIPGFSPIFPGTMLTPANGGFIEGWVDNAPTAQTDFPILKDGTQVATARWAASSHSPTLVMASNTAVALGDYFDVQMPANLNGMSGKWRLSLTYQR